MVRKMQRQLSQVCKSWNTSSATHREERLKVAAMGRLYTRWALTYQGVPFAGHLATEGYLWSEQTDSLPGKEGEEGLAKGERSTRKELDRATKSKLTHLSKRPRSLTPPETCGTNTEVDWSGGVEKEVHCMAHTQITWDPIKSPEVQK